MVGYLKEKLLQLTPVIITFFKIPPNYSLGIRIEASYSCPHADYFKSPEGAEKLAAMDEY